MIYKLSKSPFRVRAVIAVATLAFASSAQAEYRLSVFDKARAHDALTQNDPAAAELAFQKPALDPMDFADINNLCVLQIIERDSVDAARSCRLALKEIQNRSIRQRDKRKMRAVVLSNLSVALVLNGEYKAAEASMDRALALDDTNREAIQNRKTFAQTRIAAK